jgi:3-methylcrotonyl-CoA carboxylase alpha subunit
VEQVIKKVLVANRGEIAIRICKTLHKMGIRSVAIYSGKDADARHTAFAHEAYLLHGDGLLSTYLNIDQIIQLARQAGADAIHPGYGFLSESAAFSRAVRQAGLVFIGPGDEAIRLMGNKVEARSLVEKLHVPVAKGAIGQPEDLIALASSIGFPLLVKAAAGGGGKGMRIVNDLHELPDVLETTQREAQSYFGNGEVYIERYLENPKHIEVQLMADEHGHTVCLFERECSIQRRYQKIIEEAPSPSVSPALREKLMDAAKRIATGIGYVNAGTIEFLVTDGSFYFLEMNTRIQVEHPVTEMITGIDLVREQILVASGMPLSFDQESLTMKGHAIEARVYAEDPEQDFLPSPGSVVLYVEPSTPGIRIDSSLSKEGEISREFDPLISKVIAHGNSREEARQNLKQALISYAVHGIKTNLSYLIELLDSELFISGNTDTGFCKHVLPKGPERLLQNQSLQMRLAAAYLYAGTHQKLKTKSMPQGKALSHTRSTRFSDLWDELGYWRLSMTPQLRINGQKVAVNISNRKNGRLLFRANDKQIAVELIKISDEQISIREEDSIYELFFSSQKEGVLWIQTEGYVHEVGFVNQLNEEEINNKSHHAGINGHGTVNAPMHGKIIKVLVKTDEIVDKGDVLLILESMKIENKIISPGRAKVSAISVAAGDVVASNALLVMLSGDV